MVICAHKLHKQQYVGSLLAAALDTTKREKREEEQEIKPQQQQARGPYSFRYGKNPRARI